MRQNLDALTDNQRRQAGTTTIVTRRAWSILRMLIMGAALAAMVSCSMGPKPGTPCKSDVGCQPDLVCGELGTCEYQGLIDTCLQQAKCRDFGYCVAHEGFCRSTVASCKASVYCKDKGYCTRANGGIGCQVATDTDCQSSTECQTQGKCRAHGGECINPREQ